MGMDFSHLITAEDGKRSGKPCIRGTRATVGDVLEFFAAGKTRIRRRCPCSREKLTLYE
jgi:uncharacterized protein (DUF433 family)